MPYLRRARVNNRLVRGLLSGANYTSFASGSEATGESKLEKLDAGGAGKEELGEDGGALGISAMETDPSMRLTGTALLSSSSTTSFIFLGSALPLRVKK